MRSRTLALLALATVPLLAACGEDDPPAAAAARGTTTTIGMAGSQFGPATAEVHAGETVVFENDDTIAHTATATEGASFDSGTLEPGGTYEYVAQRTGTLAYVCQFHPGMTGVLTVR